MHQLWAQTAGEISLPEIEVISAAPLAAGAERDRVPANTKVLRREDLVRTGPANALRSLDEQVGGVTLGQAQGNPFQPNLTYRGFEASPLVGNAQGLAVYINGTRFNAPFGDTTNWDLIPDMAIERIELTGANPAFGLNALGGAVSVRLRDGFGYQGATAEVSGGSFGRIQASAQYGVQAGAAAGYVALSALNEDGWRRRSPSQLRQIYGDLGFRGDKTELHVSLLGAQNRLTGNGPAPVELLAADRRAVFTYPDTTKNRYLRAMLSGTTEVSAQVSVQASVYVSALSQRTINGDAADVAPCPEDGNLLCTNDGAPLTGRGGERIGNTVNPGFYGAPAFPGGGPYALRNDTATDSTGYGAAVQATHTSEAFGRPNRLLVGASLDGGETTFSARTSVGALSLDRAYVGPGTVIALDDGSITPVRVSARNRYYGVYAQDAIDLTPALTLTLSGRLNVSDIRLRDRLGGPLSGDHSYTHFNPAAGLTYKVTPWLSAYAGFAVANRTPTPAELSCASAASPCSLTNFFVADPALKQVVAQTWEAGLRGTAEVAGASVGWNAGVFRTDSDDDILFTNSAVAGRGFFGNVGRTRRQGVEAGLQFRQGPVSATVGYAYTDATFQTAFTAVSRNNPAANPDGSMQVQRGDRIAGVPQHLLKFGVQYAITPEWVVGTTGVVSSGRVLQGDPANLTPHTGSYVLVNFNTSYRVNESVELFGLVQNAFDQRYATFGTFSPVGLVPIVQVANAGNPRSVTPGAPLAGYGGVRVRF